MGPLKSKRVADNINRNYIKWCSLYLNYDQGYQKHQNMRDIIYGPPQNKVTFDQMFETV